MHFTTSTVVAALAAGALGKVVTVNVAQGGLTFSPNNIKADKGDTLEFHFYPNSHSVVQGDGSKACQPVAGGFYSGVVKSSGGMNSQVFRVTVQNTDEMFLYCGVSDHCSQGMVAVVNPKSDKDVSDYAAAAGNANDGSAPSGGPTGGVFADANSPVGGGGSMMSSMMMSSQAMMSSTAAMSQPMSSTAGGMSSSMAMSMSMARSTNGQTKPSSSPTTVPSSAAGSLQAGIGSAFAAVAAIAAFVL